MRLSERLETIISMVPRIPGGCRVADVGTDHGFVPIRLVQEGTASTALAMDVRQGPLQRAAGHIREAGYEAVIETRLSDGLEKLVPGEVDGVVITGMGGELMLRILKDGGHVRDTVKWWVLSPQSELCIFRHGLEELGLSISREVMLQEDGKYYTVILAQPGQMHYEQEFYYRYGPCLIQEASPVLLEFLHREERKLQEILEQLEKQESQAAKRRYLEMTQELEEIKKTYDVMQGSDPSIGSAGASDAGL